ncbi:MAG: AraC family transcriptional regulator [Methylococcaceae bacterium]|nr:AraC family transcriptional regulator [Methylococcaceae bacterium]
MSKKIHYERMNKVIQAIENNLDSKNNIDELSKIACYSKFHFHRLFRSFFGESIYAYRKRLLLERAVKHLRYSNESMTEIAYKCGYENQSSFNKAFKIHFSYTPSQVREQKLSINVYKSKLNFKKGIQMKPEIIMIDDIKVICAREKGSYSESTWKAWDKIMKFAYSNHLMGEAVRKIGLSHDDPNITDAEFIRYDACVDIENDIVFVEEDDFNKQTITGGCYAKFLHKGAYEGFKDTYSYIFNDWLPESHYKVRDKPCFEIYLNRDPRRTKPENLKTEVYIPIK